MSDIRIDHDNEGLAPPERFTGRFEYYWPNRQLKFRANYVEGKEHGEVTCWWENGVVAQTGQSEFGACQGVWTDYHQDGTKFYETEYEHGETLLKRWYLEGEVYEIGEYRNGIQFKKTEYQKGNTTIISWVSPAPGSFQDVVNRKEEWRNGAKVREFEYTDKSNFVVRWYSNGDVERVDEWCDGQIVAGTDD